MNKKLIFILIIISSLLLTGFIGYYLKNNKDYTKYYLLQIGAYKSYDGISKKTKEFDNYLVVKEDDLYKLYIGITKNEEVFNKMVRLYVNSNSFYKKEILFNNKSLDDSINKLDLVVLNSNNINEINLVIKSELKLLEKILEKDSI